MTEGYQATLRASPSAPSLLRKERDFHVTNKHAPLKSYSALQDDALWHFWANPAYERHHMQAGFLSREGQLVDVDKFRRKMYVVEKELALAAELDRKRIKDAEVLMEQKKKMREAERCQKIRDREVQQYINGIREKRRALQGLH
mmetsp:Transcript_4951/g.12413  ORF Transcript_4951/g.12413 Transcript_4951/m.12413 type:complete len:144 (+) Transcript_4951:131-562(+)|eukprot:CAMPEP_0178996938 /NCGR_PEP_ID=MMETSP0795-20121207/8653_1 /TAXON_ID=88552 /ORGANISM="Amoebophrya sp., Strain Ameob2" /LENGTH=143 /DNA_ID=CAMNT_0020689397 /DNA_START=41 /DNA_END=472 /DNA_ORIENTATION=-